MSEMKIGGSRGGKSGYVRANNKRWGRSDSRANEGRFDDEELVWGSEGK